MGGSKKVRDVYTGGGRVLPSKPQPQTTVQESRLTERKGPPTQELCAIWLDVGSFSGKPCDAPEPPSRM